MKTQNTNDDDDFISCLKNAIDIMENKNKGR